MESQKKVQRNLEQFWELWKNHHLLSFRERSQLFNKHPRMQSVKVPRIGDIVQVKDSSPRGTWRVERVIEMIKDQVGKERAARVMMNKIILQKSIIHLYPLECNDEEQLNEIPRKINLKVNRNGKELKNDELRIEMNQGDKEKHRPKRAAAAETGNKIRSNFNGRMSISQAKTFWRWWECRERVRTFIFDHHKSARTFTNIESI